ncbi:MAG TPA: transposase [Geobacter sp.]|nr:transposase [Geobacter sp.]
MSTYRRAHDGNTYFFTIVTYQRQPILCLEQSRGALREAIVETRKAYPFSIAAWVLLPDHLHCIWELPEGDTDYSTRWSLIKRGFTRSVRECISLPEATMSRSKHRESTVWQRRFWEHRIHDDRDFAAHCDYIHYNPVKHGLVSSACDWPFSTFRRMVGSGMYPDDWCRSQPPDVSDLIAGE